MNREAIKTHALAGVGAAEGLVKYYKPEIAMTVIGCVLGHMAIKKLLEPYTAESIAFNAHKRYNVEE